MRQSRRDILPGLRPLTNTLGAEVTGVNLADCDQLWPRVHEAFLAHHLLVFRDQQLQESQFQALAERFGPIETNYVKERVDGKPAPPIHYIQNLDASGNVVANPYGNLNFYWHTDKQYLRHPSLLTMLQAIELPPSGGDTEFADMTAAYEALPPEMKMRLEGLRAIYSYEHMIQTRLQREITEEERRKAPPMEHPLVRTHAETGRKSLFLGMYCSAIVGMPTERALPLIHHLQELATNPRFTYTHRWRHGDVVMWDNRCLIHRAIDNFDMASHRRVLRRVVTRGEMPR